MMDNSDDINLGELLEIGMHIIQLTYPDLYSCSKLIMKKYLTIRTAIVTVSLTSNIHETFFVPSEKKTSMSFMNMSEFP